ECLCCLQVNGEFVLVRGLHLAASGARYAQGPGVRAPNGAMRRRPRSQRGTVAASGKKQRCAGASTCAGPQHNLPRRRRELEKLTLRCRDQSSSQLAWPSPPNQVTLGDPGTYVPVEEPSTASITDSCSAANSVVIRSLRRQWRARPVEWSGRARWRS